MSDIPNTESSDVSMHAIRWEMTKIALLSEDYFIQANTKKKIDMLVYSYAKTYDIYKKSEELKDPFTK